jgi:hypothetical protein
MATDATSRAKRATAQRTQTLRSGSQKKQRGSRKKVISSPARPTTTLITLTIDPRTARIVRLEGVDAAGRRHELTAADTSSWLERPQDQSVERLVERAFEAGIACVLDGDCGPDNPNESREDVELAHRLLVPLIEQSSAKALVARDVLDRAILHTLLERSATSPTAVTSKPEARAH